MTRANSTEVRDRWEGETPLEPCFQTDRNSNTNHETKHSC